MGGEGDEVLKPRGAQWASRAAPGLLALALAFVAVAVLAGPPAAATSRSGQEQIDPRNRVRPQIFGTPRVGVSLRATHGAWTPPRSVVYRYRWLRCPPGGAKCVRIAHAAGPHYKPAGADVGTTLRVTVTAANAAGSARATSGRTRVVRVSRTTPVIALWHMDETTGNVMHDSLEAHSGTLQAVQVGLPGLKGTSYGFNGRDSDVSVPSTADLNPERKNVALTIHFKTTDTPGPGPGPADADLIRKGTYAAGGSEYKMELQHSGQASCGFEGSAGYADLIAGPRLNDGRWHTAQCVKAPTAIQLVVDGKMFTHAANIGSIANSAPVVIGARPGGDWYAGYLDEISIQIG
jgi:concanavalin A-like lectin/glucanase superfamily protein